MGDASSEENVLGQKCVLCEVKASCCNYMGLPLCFDDRSAVRAWKRKALSRRRPSLAILPGGVKARVATGGEGKMPYSEVLTQPTN